MLLDVDPTCVVVGRARPVPVVGSRCACVCERCGSRPVVRPVRPVRPVREVLVPGVVVAPVPVLPTERLVLDVLELLDIDIIPVLLGVPLVVTVGMPV